MERVENEKEKEEEYGMGFEESSNGIGQGYEYKYEEEDQNVYLQLSQDVTYIWDGEGYRATYNFDTTVEDGEGQGKESRGGMINRVNFQP